MSFNSTFKILRALVSRGGRVMSSRKQGHYPRLGYAGPLVLPAGELVVRDLQVWASSLGSARPPHLGGGVSLPLHVCVRRRRPRVGLGTFSYFGLACIFPGSPPFTLVSGPRPDPEKLGGGPGRFVTLRAHVLPFASVVFAFL